MNAPLLQDLAPSQLPERARALLESGGRLQMAYAWFPDGAIELRYLAAARPKVFEIWRVRPENGTAPSLAAVAPLLSWYEREIADLCGVRFEGRPEPDPLVLLPGARASAPPLTPGADLRIDYTPQFARLPEIAGPDRADVQVLPFGPVRGDVLESAQFLFLYIGEAILHYLPKLFFKHRGMEKRFEGLNAPFAPVLAERVSGVDSVAHALACCQALEAAAGCAVPPRAHWLRVLLAELERLYNHLHYLGHLCHTTTLKVGEAQGKYLEELAKQINGRLAGSRFLRGLVIPGGLHREPRLDGLRESLARLQEQFAPYAEMLETSTTHLDRLITTGVLPRRTAFDQGATGPIERASGLDRDLRRDHPYAAYDELKFPVALRTAGDAHARQQVRLAEIESSLALIRAVLDELPEGPVHAECTPPPGSEGLGWAESPRGSLYYAVHVGSDGRIARMKIKSPSFSNWRAFPFTVHDTNMMDYAIDEASFGLTVAGCDR